MKLTLANLRREAGVNSLLSAQDTNPKTKKNGKLGQMTATLHLAPGNMSGFETCPKRSPGCTAACLHFAGSPVYQTAKTQSRIKKTKLFFNNRDLFMNLLVLELEAHIAAAKRKGLEPSVRLNATSDILWEVKKFTNWRTGEQTDILSLFPSYQFYDYTKVKGRNTPANYHLTFSLSEINGQDAMLEQARGRNLAVVFFDSHLPATFWGRPVIDGDEHDYRPSDPQGVIVGLKAKGAKGKADRSGFVLENDVYEIKAAA